MDSLHLLIAADDPLARAGLALLLADDDQCVVVDRLSSADATAVSPHDDYDTPPAAVLWDVGWEPPDALPDWDELGLPVVALLAETADAGLVWASGVRALLPRDAAPGQLVAAAQAVVQGLTVLAPGFAAALLTPGVETAVPDNDLTPRETEVLQLLAEGLTNRAIAARLGISEHTVKFHVNALMSKLHAQSRTDAVVRATRLGLLLL